MEIAEFLLARIAEDEDWVRQCGDDFAPASQPDNSTRVLAKCAADRRIVELATGPIYRLVERVENEWGGSVGTDTDADGDLLRALALPYADHPSYDPEWKV